MIFRKSREFNLQKVIDGCIDGKGTAQKQLFERYYTLVKRICYRYGNNTNTVDEMLNDSFLKVFNKISLYDRNQNFEAWLKTVAIRTCIDFYRRNKPKEFLTDIEEAYALESNNTIIDDLNANEILKLIQELPTAYRTVFALYAIDGYSHAEIAQMLGINEGTSRSNLAKARGKLQEWIKRYSEQKQNLNNHVRREV